MAKVMTDTSMKLTLSRKDLAKALDFAARVVQRRTTIPILSNVRLTAALDASGRRPPGAVGECRSERHSMPERAGINGRLTLAATDLDLEAQTSVEAEVAAAGDLTVSAATFAEIVRKLAADKVSLDFDASNNRLAVKAARAKFHLATLPAADWPTLERGEMSHSFALPAATLARALKKTSFAISTEETRYYLNGIFVHATEAGELRFVATDGHRLARFGMTAPEGSAEMPGVIIPSRAVAELARLAEAAAKENGDIAIEVSPQKILFRAGETTLLSKLIDGSFPDYERVIPRSNDRIVTLSRETFAPALDRVATLVSERGRAVKLAFADDCATLSVTSADMGSATEDLDAGYDGSPLEIGFNPRYVADALNALDGDQARLELIDGGRPAILREREDADFLAVLMPMRI